MVGPWETDLTDKAMKGRRQSHPLNQIHSRKPCPCELDTNLYLRIYFIAIYQEYWIMSTLDYKTFAFDHHRG